MSQELSKNLKCVLMRSGVRIWVEEERAANLQEALKGITQHKFIFFEGESFNTADLEGVYKATTMAELTRRKNGDWQCDYGEWHKKFSECGCRPKDTTCAKCYVTPCVCLEEHQTAQ